jgi:hypothetical protein
MAADVSNSGTKNMPKRSRIFPLAAASFLLIAPVGWLVLDHSLNLNAGAAPSAAVRSKTVAQGSFQTADAANQTTTPELDQTRHLAYWTSVLKNRKRTCDFVVRTIYQGGSDAGIDSWSVRCQDGHSYLISIDPNTQDSVCHRNTFGNALNNGGE